MGDPFSVAGTAVGITSLGIQACQILHRYYSQYRGHHDDIEAVLREVEGLQGILRGLKQVKGRIEIDNHEPSSQLHIALLACQEVLEKLESMARQCQAEKDPGDVQARIRAVLKRSAWPFKKDTLTDLRDTLSRFQDNVSLALQSAGLGAVLREVDGIQPALGSLHAQNMVIQERQGHQLDALRSVHDDVATSFEYQRWSHQEISHDLSDVQRQLARYGESLHFITKALVASSASPRDLSTVSPSLLSEAAHRVDAITPAFETTLSKHRNLFHESSVRRTRGTAIAACQCHPKKRTARKHRRWYSVFSESIYTHAQDCPRFAYADYSETVTIQFFFSMRVVGACIQAGLQRSRRGGWSSIAPTLRYRAVRPDSKAFEILRSAQNQVQKRNSHSKLPHLVSETFSALQTCFGKDAHPTDLDENGHGIMECVLRLLHSFIQHGYRDTIMLCAFIDTCSAQGVPVTQTTLMLWHSDMAHLLDDSEAIDHRRIDACSGVLTHLISTLDIWTIELQQTQFVRSVNTFYAVISGILSMEDYNLNLDEDDPLARAILERSETLVASCLNVAKLADWASLPERMMLIDAIACWPEVVRLVIESGLLHPSDDVIVKLLDAAIENTVWQSIEILLNFGVRVKLRHWQLLNFQYSRSQGSKDCIFDQVVDNFRWVATEVLRVSRAFSRSPTAEIIERRTANHQYTTTLYHEIGLIVEAAEGAWLAGSRDLNSVSGDGTTPLWVCVADSYSMSNAQWRTARWLISHGADATWIHPVYLTTPAHILIRQSVEATCSDFAEDKSKSASISKKYLQPVIAVCNVLSDAVQLYQTDECVCDCSKQGCSVLSCAVSSSSMAFGRAARSNMPKSKKYTYHRTTARPYLFSLVECADQPDQIALSILRVLTFEKLHLLHTCCYRVLDEMRPWRNFKRPTPEEAVHDTDPRDLELLETLMDEFEVKWSTYKKPFATFVKRVWKPRMRQIRKEREVNQEIYQAELVRIGVILNDKNEEKPKTESDSDTGYDSDYELDWDSETLSENSESEGESEGDSYETADEEVEEEVEGRQENVTSDERGIDESGGVEHVRE